MSVNIMQRKLVTVEEAAAMTGMSPAWWRAAINGRKSLPPVRIVRLGGSVRIHLADLLAFIDGNPSPKRGRGRPRKKAPENANMVK